MSHSLQKILLQARLARLGVDVRVRWVQEDAPGERARDHRAHELAEVHDHVVEALLRGLRVAVRGCVVAEGLREIHDADHVLDEVLADAEGHGADKEGGRASVGVKIFYQC